jgi:hypothetical protein
MKNLIRATLLIFAAFLISCSTPYGERGIIGGYSDSSLGQNRYRVKVIGNDWTSEDSLEEMWNSRAAELTAKYGFKTYKTVFFRVGREAYGLNVVPGAKTANGIIELQK